MSELYGTGTGGGETSEPAAETNPVARTEGEPAPDTPVSQYEDDAAIEARLDEADLPTRAEARAAARQPEVGDEDDDFDVDDFGPESDAAIEARLDEAGLPTRAEARAAAREPDAADEDDFDEDDFGQPDKAIPAAADGEHALTPEQERISALEAKDADTEKKLADTQQQLADTQQQIADLKRSFEQMLAGGGRQQERLDVSVPDYEGPHTAADQLGAQDAADVKPEAADPGIEQRHISQTEAAARKNDTKSERHLFTAENISLLGTFAGLGEAATQVMVNVPVEVGLGVAVVGSVAAVMDRMKRKSS